MNPNIVKLVLLGHVSELPQEYQDAIKSRIKQLEELVQDDAGKIAMSIVAADIAIKEESK